MTDDEFEPARRELCPDGACIGIIGPDGRCRVCGTVGASAVADPRHRGMRPLAPEEDGADSDGRDSGELDSGELDDERELCPDGTCIGVIGPDGRCKECGARATRAPRVAAGSEARPAVHADAAMESGDESPSSEDDDDRELCPDDSCIGLMGPDGRCKVCGTARPSTAS
ncbi:MAG TPA: hypothetical protein VEL05_01915 [Candidatus Acidoferrum sp.]|nr:hypothetical protein [Candidatus Acidoferrum sp.]